MSLLINPYRFAVAGGGGGGSDPNISSVVLLINPTGAQNSTTFTDLSPAAHTLTANGAAKIDNTSSAFPLGTILCNTAGSDFVSAADSADWAFGSGDFTMEIFWEPLGLGDHYIMGQGDSSIRAWDVMAVEASKEKYFNRDGTSVTEAGTFSYSTSTGYYLAVDRSGTAWRIYRGSTSGTASMIAKVTGSATLTDSTEPFRIGNGFPSNGSKCRIGGVRITKGVARFASDSGGAVPSLPFPTS